jgi:enolase-phosphatase E1
MIRAVVTDIEGTTSSLSFVKDVLFPYARRHIGPFLERHGEESEVSALLSEVRGIMGLPNARLREVVDQLHRWIDEDRKITPLKALQGLVWEDGYRTGAFAGHIYDDAAEVLAAWKARGLRLHVYSSGSVQAQKLLFAHTSRGDLTPLFSGYYDTRIGPKVESDSYLRIAHDIGFPAPNILFLSDVERELDAAAAAGMQTWQLVREGEGKGSVRHRSARTFFDVQIESFPR